MRGPRPVSYTHLDVYKRQYNFSDLKEYVAADQELGSESFKFYAEIAANKDQANTVYIVDEASLLSDVYSESEFFRSGTGYLLHDLISYVGFEHGETDRKIIFVGDPAQLPPVGMSASPALDADSLRKHFALDAVEYELKEVLRQKADSGVIRNVMPLRDSLSKGTFGSLSFDFDEDVPVSYTHLDVYKRQAHPAHGAWALHLVLKCGGRRTQ